MDVRKRSVPLTLAVIAAGAAGLVLWFLLPRGAAPPERFEPVPLSRVTARPAVLEGSSRYQEIRLQTTEGRVHHGLLRFPASAEGPFVTMILVGGIESGRGCVRHPPESGTPILWAALDYPYRPPRKGSVFSYARKLPRASDEGEAMVRGLRLLLTYLEGRDDVDPARTLICGASLGTFPAVIAAATDTRFEGLIVLNGGAGLERIVAANLRINPPWMRRVAAGLLRPWLGPFEPEHFVGRVAPRPFLQIHGTQDRMISPECARLLFEAAEEPKEILWIDMPHVITGNELLGRDVETAVLEWMARRGWSFPG